MPILTAPLPTRCTATRSASAIDVRRLGLLTLDAAGALRHRGGVRVPLALAARLAEADRLLPPGQRLLVLRADADTARSVNTCTAGAVDTADPAAGPADLVDTGTVDVTLADDRGFPLWMGALPTGTGGDEAGACLPIAASGAVSDRQATLRAALTAAGLERGTGPWFRWSARRGPSVAWEAPERLTRGIR